MLLPQIVSAFAIVVILTAFVLEVRAVVREGKQRFLRWLFPLFGGLLLSAVGALILTGTPTSRGAVLLMLTGMAFVIYSASGIKRLRRG